MKKVLIITYYWPPSGGGGVQRWLKMSAYMKQFGCEPIIYTPENPAFNVKDPSLMKDVMPDIRVIKTPIFEPIDVFFKMFKMVGKKAPEQKDLLSTRNDSFFQRAATWVRGNWFVPDARITWVRPSVRFLKKFIEEENIEHIITTGPPHSMHLIGLRLKKKFPHLQWIVDFRDPWSEWDLWDSLKTGQNARKKHRALESEVLTKSDLAVSISKFHVDRLIALGAKRCELVANGFDPRDFDHVPRQTTEKFVIRHLGSIDELRDPRPFMQAMSELISEKKIDGLKISIEFIGPVNESFKSFVQENDHLKNITLFKPAVPHSQVVQLYRSSSLLLLILAHTDIAAGNTPGKMYEYMASGTPILGIGPEDGDAAEILNDTQCGKIIDRSKKDAMKEMIHEHYDGYIAGKDMLTTGASPFSRKALTEKFCQFIR